VRDAALGLKKIAAGSGYPSLFVYALAWLTELDRDALRDADPILIGRDASLRDMLLAAAAQNRSLTVADDATTAAVRAVRTRLTNRPVLTPLDRARSERVSRSATVTGLVDDIAPHAGTAAIRSPGMAEAARRRRSCSSRRAWPLITIVASPSCRSTTRRATTSAASS